ncbi:MAG: GIY-YIG nuclease family protein [Syntrophomonadaceae bacterium]|nr:GIY-YIG nuclease family protein [Syntrophomonadaceae bacterium]
MVYILASKFNGTLYVGVTSDLLRRLCEHRNDLVYDEDCGNIETVIPLQGTGEITREKQIKGWRRVYNLKVTR